MVLDIISAAQITADTIQIDLITEYEQDYLINLTFTIEDLSTKESYTDNFDLIIGDDLKTLFLKLKTYTSTPLPNTTYQIYLLNTENSNWDQVDVVFNQRIESMSLYQTSSNMMAVTFDKLIPVSFYQSMDFELYKIENDTSVIVSDKISISAEDSSDNFDKISIIFSEESISNTGYYKLICNAKYTDEIIVTIESESIYFDSYIKIKSIELNESLDLVIELNTKNSTDTINSLEFVISDSKDNIIQNSKESSDNTSIQYFKKISESNNFSDTHTDKFIIALNSYENLLSYDTYIITLYNDDMSSTSQFKIVSYLSINSIDTSTYGITKIVLDKSYDKEFLESLSVSIYNTNTNETVMNYFGDLYLEMNSEGNYDSIYVPLLDKKYNIPDGVYKVELISSNDIEMSSYAFESKTDIEFSNISQIDLFTIRVEFENIVDIERYKNFTTSIYYNDEDNKVDITSLFSIVEPASDTVYSIDFVLNDKTDTLPCETICVDLLTSLQTVITSGSVDVNNSINISIYQEAYNKFIFIFSKYYPVEFLLNSTISLFKLENDEVDYSSYIKDIPDSNPTLTDSSNEIYIMLSDNLKALPEGQYTFYFKTKSDETIANSEISVSNYFQISKLYQTGLSIISLTISNSLPLYYLRSLVAEYKFGDEIITDRFTSVNDYIDSLYETDTELTEESTLRFVNLIADESLGIPNGIINVAIYDNYGTLLDSGEVDIDNEIEIMNISNDNNSTFSLLVSKIISKEYLSNTIFNVNKIETSESDEFIRTDVTSLFSSNTILGTGDTSDNSSDIIKINVGTDIILEKGDYEFILTHTPSNTSMSNTLTIDEYSFDITNITQLDLFSLRVYFRDSIKLEDFKKFQTSIYYNEYYYNEETDKNEITKIDISSSLSIVEPEEDTIYSIDLVLADKSDALPNATIYIELLSSLQTVLTSNSIEILNYITPYIYQEAYNKFRFTFSDYYPSKFLLNTTVNMYKLEKDENDNTVEVDYSSCISDIIDGNPTLSGMETENEIYITLSDNLKALPEGQYKFYFKTKSNQNYAIASVEVYTHFQISKLYQTGLSVVELSISENLPLYYLRSLDVRYTSDNKDITDRFTSVNDYIDSLYETDTELTEESTLRFVNLIADESLGIPNGTLKIDIYDGYGILLDSGEVDIDNEIEIYSITHENMTSIKLMLTKDISAQYLSNTTVVANRNEMIENEEVRTDVSNLFSKNMVLVLDDESDSLSGVVKILTSDPSIILEKGNYEFILTHTPSNTSMSNILTIDEYSFDITNITQLDLFSLRVYFSNEFSKGHISSYDLKIYKGTPTYEKDKDGNILNVTLPSSIIDGYEDFKITNEINDSSYYEMINTIDIKPIEKYKQIPEGELTIVLSNGNNQLIGTESFETILNSSNVSVSVSNIGDEINFYFNELFPIEYIKSLDIKIINKTNNEEITFFESFKEKVIDSTSFILYPSDKSNFLPPASYIVRISDLLSNVTIESDIVVGDFISFTTPNEFDIEFDLNYNVPVYILKGLRYELFDIYANDIETINNETYLSIIDSNDLNIVNENSIMDSFKIKTISKYYDIPEGEKKIRIFNPNNGYEHISCITALNLFTINKCTELSNGVEINLSSALNEDYVENLILEVLEISSEDTYGEDILPNYSISYYKNDEGLVSKIILTYTKNSYHNPIGKYAIILTNLISKKIRTNTIDFRDIVYSVSQNNLFDLKIEFIEEISIEFIKTMKIQVFDIENSNSNETLTDVSDLFDTIENSNVFSSEYTDLISLKLKDIQNDLVYGNKLICISSDENKFSQEFRIEISNILQINTISISDYQELTVTLSNKLPVRYLKALSFKITGVTDAKDYTDKFDTLSNFNSFNKLDENEYIDTFKIQTLTKYYELPSGNYNLILYNSKKANPHEITKIFNLNKIYSITGVTIDSSYNLEINIEPAMSKNYILKYIAPLIKDSNYESNKIGYEVYYKSLEESNVLVSGDGNELTTLKLRIGGQALMFADNTYSIALKNTDSYVTTEYCDYSIVNEISVESAVSISNSEILISFSKNISVAYASELTFKIYEADSESNSDLSSYFNTVSVSNSIDAYTDESSNISILLPSIKLSLNSVLTKDLYEGMYNIELTNSKSNKTVSFDAYLVHMSSTHGDISSATVITSRTLISGYSGTENQDSEIPNVPCLKIEFSKYHMIEEIVNSSVSIYDSAGNLINIFKTIDASTYMVKSSTDETLSNEIYLEMNNSSIMEAGTYKIIWNWNSIYYESISYDFTLSDKVISNFGRVTSVSLHDGNVYVYLEYPVSLDLISQFTLSYVSNDDNEDCSEDLSFISYNPVENCAVYNLTADCSIHPGSYTVQYKYNDNTVISEFTGILSGLLNDSVFSEFTSDPKTVYVIKRTKNKNTKYLVFKTYEEALEKYEKIQNKNITNKEQYEMCKKCQKQKLIYTKKTNMLLKNLRFGKQKRYKYMLKIISKYIKSIFGCSLVKLSQSINDGERTFDCLNEISDYNEISAKILMVSAPNSYNGSAEDDESYLVYYKWKKRKKYAIFTTSSSAEEFVEWLEKKNKANNKKAKKLCSKCVKKELGLNKKGKKITLNNYLMPLDTMNNSEIKEFTESRLTKVVSANFEDCTETAIVLKEYNKKSCKAVCANRETVDSSFETDIYECEEF